MNAYANVFNRICDYEIDQNNLPEAKKYFKKAVEFNTKNLTLDQSEIDDLLGKYGNKSVPINESLLNANLDLLKENPDCKEVVLFLTDKFFKLDGLAQIFLKQANFSKR